jgi:hypothetical protein
MPTCFVVMGFGVKTDYQTGRKLDLDKSYQNLIKPAVEAAGLTCVRADEIVHAGIIDVPMYKQLLLADVVVADVSTMNPNAFYELGVRHALRPHTTIIVAESELKFPFDVGHSVVRQYKHLGEDIGYSEVRRFQAELTKAIQTILAKPADDSPVYTFLRLNPPSEIIEAAAVAAASFAAEVPAPEDNQTLRLLLDEAQKARASGNWTLAKVFLQGIRTKMQKNVDSYIIQQLALATYKADSSEAGLKEACNVMEELNPTTSNDPETLGLWGAIHKRLWEKSGDRKALDDAVVAYERGFYIKSDYYNGINVAFLLNIRASVSAGDEATADRVIANRIRKQIVPMCKKCLEEPDLKAADRYWIMATLAEAYFGLGDKAMFESTMAEAAAIAPEPWMLGSTREQVGKLDALLGKTAAP